MPSPNEPAMGRNFWLAMVLSMLVIFGYPAFMNWMYPPAPETLETEEMVETEMESAALQIEKTAPADSGYFEKPAPPQRITAENELYKIEFSTLGGSVTHLWFNGEPGTSNQTQDLLYDQPEMRPGNFLVRLRHHRENLGEKIFNYQEGALPNHFVFTYEEPGDFRLTKSYRLDAKAPVLHLEILIENLSSRPRHFPLEFEYALDASVSNGQMEAQHREIVVWTDKVKSANYDKVSKKGFEAEGPIRWAGAIKLYYAVLARPSWKTVALSAEAGDDRIIGKMVMEPLTLAPGESTRREMLIYAGPQRYETLTQFGAGFEEVLSKGFFGQFKVWLLVALKFLNQFTHNYGFAIILLTILIKLVFWPLTHISYKSMKKMQVIQPKIKSIQEKYKKDPERMNRETMELFKRNRVNPMAGCLPMLIQMPILFAMFRLLPEAIELKNAPFLFWIQDLSSQDRLMPLPFSVPVLGWNALNLLPILMVLSQFAYQKMMPQTSTSPEQAKIMGFMPIFFGVICYSMPSGLVLYWLVQNLVSMVQQVFTNRIVIALHHEDQDR